MNSHRPPIQQQHDADASDARFGHSLLTEQAPDAAQRLRMLFASSQCDETEESEAFDAFREAINESRRDGRLLYP